MIQEKRIMKNITKVLTATVLTGAVTLAAGAADTTKVESYAHPSLFGQQVQEYSSGKASYLTGAKLAQPENKVGVVGKDNVLVDTWAKGMLNILKNNQGDTFNPKMPVLRSELAVILAESFAGNTSVAPGAKKYSDISDKYWAKNWIYKALNSNLMIGYPSGKFLPDQPVTKAEVFATIAQIIDVNIANIPNVNFKDREIQYIPLWSVNATKEVIGSNLLEQVPDTDKVISEQYLSKQQVAYLISALRSDLAYYKRLSTDPNAPDVIKKYSPTVLSMKLTNRVDAKHSNVGDVFTAKTTNEVTVAGECFPAGSTVKGEVTQVQRPGVKNPGFIQVKFKSINKKDCSVEFPETVSEAKADTVKNPNIAARLLAAPFSATGRVVGVTGRSAATMLNVAGNRLEEAGADTSDLFAESLSLHAGSGVKSFGNAFVATGKGVVELAETAVSGVFGILYEIGDELVYLVVPSKSNGSALNPDEEILVIF